MILELEGLQHRKDLINNALSFLKWAIEHIKEGHTIAAVDHESQKYIEVEIPIFDAVRNIAK